MYCSNCGELVNDMAISCPKCGYAQNEQIVDSGGFGWSAIGCCFPVVGLILFLVWKDVKPNSSKSVGIGALLSLGIIILFYALSFIMGMIFYI